MKSNIVMISLACFKMALGASDMPDSQTDAESMSCSSPRPSSKPAFDAPTSSCDKRLTGEEDAAEGEIKKPRTTLEDTTLSNMMVDDDVEIISSMPRTPYASSSQPPSKEPPQSLRSVRDCLHLGYDGAGSNQPYRPPQSYDSYRPPQSYASTHLWTPLQLSHPPRSYDIPSSYDLPQPPSVAYNENHTTDTMTQTTDTVSPTVNPPFSIQLVVSPTINFVMPGRRASMPRGPRQKKTPQVPSTDCHEDIRDRGNRSNADRDETPSYASRLRPKNPRQRANTDHDEAASPDEAEFLDEIPSPDDYVRPPRKIRTKKRSRKPTVPLKCVPLAPKPKIQTPPETSVQPKPTPVDVNPSVVLLMLSDEMKSLLKSKNVISAFQAALETDNHPIPPITGEIDYYRLYVASPELVLFIKFFNAYVQGIRKAPGEYNIEEESCRLFKLLTKREDANAKFKVKCLSPGPLQYFFAAIFSPEWTDEQAAKARELMDNEGGKPMEIIQSDAEKTAGAKRFFSTGSDRDRATNKAYEYIFNFLGTERIKTLMVTKFREQCQDEKLCVHFKRLYELFFDGHPSTVIFDVIYSIENVSRLNNESTSLATFLRGFRREMKAILIDISQTFRDAVEILGDSSEGTTGSGAYDFLSSLYSDTAIDKKCGLRMCDGSIELFKMSIKRLGEMIGSVEEKYKSLTGYMPVVGAFAIFKISHCLYSLLILLFDPREYATALSALEDLSKQLVLCQMDTNKAIGFIEALSGSTPRI